MKTLLPRRLPLALCAFGAAFALASCTPLQTQNAVSPDENVVTGNSVIPDADNAVDSNAADSNSAGENAVAANAAPTSAVKFAYIETVYVPGQDEMLHAHKVSRMGIDSQLKSGGNGAPALQEIIEKAPQFFPPGAKVNNWKEDDKSITVDLNSAFDKPQFWSQKGEKTTELAVYSLVNSAAKTTGAEGTSAAKPVQFTIEKKPAQTLGEFDVEGEIKPEMRLNAK